MASAPLPGTSTPGGGWLSDRARTEEAIEVIRPLADAGDDVAELWLARWLAERGQVDELRRRVASGSYHALLELARSLTGHGCLDEPRALLIDRRNCYRAGWPGSMT